MPPSQSLYQRVTATIIAELESGAVPWVRPWKAVSAHGGHLPHNAITGRPYHGINVPILWVQAGTKGYPTHGWLTFQQAKEAGARVRKGEHGTIVVFTKKLRIKDEESDEEKQIPMLRTFTVFNRDQVDNLPEPPPDTHGTYFERLHRAEMFILGTGADIRYGGNEACFLPELDFVQVPPLERFKQREPFYSTTLHELTHWSGHPSRLDRNLAGRFGSQAYAAEELIAELGAAFLCAHLGITGDLRHAGYIQNWLRLLRSDDRAVFTAAAKAQQAADFLCSLSGGGDDAVE